MLYFQREPLPVACTNCKSPECDVCDYAAELWYLPRQLELHLRYRGLEKASRRTDLSVSRSQEIFAELKSVGQKLLPLTELEWDAIEHRLPMTAPIFERCWTVCVQFNESEMLSVLEKEHSYYYKRCPQIYKGEM